ncbi:FkbM family methyltransferase [Hufsiella ginkgonis]|uniref:FkbM family methyltransferase n=1 Tax=Hufsiella ginkgonis TaxID=2695274 RepID=A0A7K1Y444_9SPHI|nr:FkbM family methyltransferase [Hufsiella ginkgonis]MXV17637.1 FkbM family methyltransferase [Hufsiella ginkgonis]
MKNRIRSFLQKILGFDNYLYWFARFRIFLLKRNKYENGFVTFMNMIRPGGIILDIGSNIGITSLPLAERFPESDIHSFEPIPANNQAFKRVMRHFKPRNVHLHEIAVGEHDGQLKLVLPIMDGARMQGLSHAYIEGKDGDWNQGEMYVAPMKKLDNMPIFRQEKPVNGIKIDVENFEYYVFKGARELLTRHRPVIYCELWANERRTSTIELLEELGYQAKIYTNGRLEDYNGQQENNFIFVAH